MGLVSAQELVGSICAQMDVDQISGGPLLFEPRPWMLLREWL
jgi:hypothetical protein